MPHLKICKVHGITGKRGVVALLANCHLLSGKYVAAPARPRNCQAANSANTHSCQEK
jgi:hypothetical protein